MSSADLYALRDLRRGYDTFTLAIDRLEVRDGEILGLLGPTGAGKSTLLRLLAGLATPDSGEIEFQQQRFDAGNLPLSVRRRITMVHQHPLMLTGTVRFNVEYGLRLRRLAKYAPHVDRVLNRLGLTRLASQPARTLSGGETQLVALARALAIEPDVLLLDEPTANLDPAHVALVEDVLREMHQERRTTIVWTTHNLFQARRVSSRTALLLSGELVQVAPTDRFFEDPSDPRSADFVHGRMVY